jgi:hypothetical protein
MHKSTHWLLATAICALAFQAFADTNELARPRKWVSASGAELLAIFVEVSGDNVVLRNRQGEPLRIARAKLSAADQALLDEAFGPVAAPPPPADEFATPIAPPPAEPPADDMSPALAAPDAPTAPIVVAGTEIPLESKTSFRAPLDKEAIKELTKAGNPATESVVGLWLPADFDPRKQWNVLLVSATANSSSIGHMDTYLAPAKSSTGWIVMAADGPSTPPKGDTTQWRWEMARAGLLALEAVWPAARNWPVATGGFSGGAKRSGYLGALLCADSRDVIGMYMGGCNEDMATAGLKEYRPDRLTFRKVPVYLSTGDKDATATVQSANKVRLSLEATGFREVRMETYKGAHDPDAPQITEALNWFKEHRAKRAAGPAGARATSRLAPPAPPAR